mgnify:CR=1 FL=1
MINEIEHEVDKTYAGIEESVKSLEAAQRKIVDLEDYKYLLFKAREIFSSKARGEHEEQEIDFSKTTLEQLRLVNVSGVISAKDVLKFGKMIFRGTKGHSILYTFNVPADEIESKFTDVEIETRVAFIIIIESGANVLAKVTRICESFQAKKYTLQTNKEAIF